MKKSEAPSPLAIFTKTVEFLTPEREAALGRRFRELNDLKARDALVFSHLPLVSTEAAKFRSATIAQDDLVSEGTIGLIQAVDKFDPAKGRLSHLATITIRSGIIAYLIRSRSMVDLTPNRKIYFRLQRAITALEAAHDGKLPPNAATLLAESLGVEEKTIISVQARLTGDTSLDVSLGDDDKGPTLGDLLPGHDPDPEEACLAAAEQAEIQATVCSAIAKLSPREQRILKARRLTEDPPQHKELAPAEGVTPQRIQQIEARAMKKLKATLGASPDLGSGHKVRPLPAQRPRRKPPSSTGKPISAQSHDMPAGKPILSAKEA